jgi:hypothetical protein
MQRYQQLRSRDIAQYLIGHGANVQSRHSAQAPLKALNNLHHKGDWRVRIMATIPSEDGTLRGDISIQLP